MPGLGIKLRQLHLGTQIAQYPQHTGSADSPNALHAADNLVTSSGSNTDQLTTRAVSEGIHAQQRTPLEAHFRAYGGRE